MNEKEAEAVVAVKEFNRIRYNLSGFASAMAGKRVEVKPGANTHTTGDVIYIRPQMSLAHRPQHDRINCEKLDDNYRMICSGCQRIEELYSDMYHELGHIIFNSLNWEIQPKEYAQQMRELGIKYWNKDFGDFLYHKMQDANPCQSVELAQNLNPTIGAGWNFFEDYRMEECVGRVRPGFTTMTWNTSETIIRSGEWQSDPIDNQLHIVWLFAQQNHNVEDFFSPEVTEPVREFIEKCKEPLNNPMHSLIWSIAFYGFMKKRGFFQKDENGKPESGGEQSEQQSGEQSGEKSGSSTGRDDKSDETTLDANDKGSSDSEDSSQNESGENESNTGNNEHDNSDGDSDGNNDPQSGQNVSQSDGDSGSNSDNGSNDTKDDVSSDSTGDGGKNSPDSNGETAPTPGQIDHNMCGLHHYHKEINLGSSVGEFDINPSTELPDHKLEAIVSQAEFYDEYCARLGPISIIDPRDINGVGRISEPDISAIQPSIIHARRVFSDSKMNKHLRSLKKGKIDGGVLGKRAWGEDERIFRKKLKPEGVDFEVCIGMDMSSSTALNGSFEDIVKIGYSTAELLSRVGVDFSLWGHRTSYEDKMSSQMMFACKSVNEPWSDSAKEKCLSIHPGNGSLDGHNFEFYRKVLQRSRARKKLLIYFTDGVIPETNKSEELPILHREFKMLKNLNITTLGIGILTDSPKQIGMDCVHVSDPSNLTAVLKEIEKRIDYAK